MKDIVIYNAKVVKSLLKHGFNIIDIRPNPQDNKRTVFLFADTEEIRRYLEKEHNIIFN
ncbi:hypothetical protein KQI38_03365 [Tissierella carlieri]|uniref:DUF5659 domain-containing protein n=1 Tax=Tissierella carlieri TaxID=689904 RepID=UPI001C10E4B1|nr:DUF5659 domain-containing protein [Tissierella carlieri]MBU5311052.1 hypothetical protein [Tissierella carlieri]